MLKTNFGRKVAYLCAIAVLFVPLAFISAPAMDSEGGGGGLLSQLRYKERLSQAQLGKIDPASASMSLATFGMRGVAANQLWTHAHHYKKTENWDAFKATLNQISKLQPNFVSVWQFQAWNISYNVSVEFDDYRHRYHWVKKGVDYLLEGNEYNRDEPLLLWDTGWFFGHKMGRADEYQQFRRLFREDDDFHTEVLSDLDFENPNNQGPDGKPDNWKVAHNYFLQAQEAVDSGKRLRSLSRLGHWVGDKRVIGKKETALKGKNPLVFHSDPPKALINYADAIEEDGFLDEIGQLAWRVAGREWNEYGDRPILSSWGIRIQLNDRDRNEREAQEAIKELESMTEGIREELEQQRRDTLTEEQRKALDVDPAERTTQQSTVAYEAEQHLKVSLEDIAKAVSAEKRTEAILIARRAMEANEQVRIIDRYREIVNFLYWKQRCEAEENDDTIAARKLVMAADRAYTDARLIEAREKYEQAWELWDGILSEYELLIDDVEGEILFEAVDRYREVLGQLEEVFPPPKFREQKAMMRLVEEFADYEFVEQLKADAKARKQQEEASPSDSPNDDEASTSDDSESKSTPADTEETVPVTDNSDGDTNTTDADPSKSSPDAAEEKTMDSPESDQSTNANPADANPADAKPAEGPTDEDSGESESTDRETGDDDSSDDQPGDDDSDDSSTEIEDNDQVGDDGSTSEFLLS